MSMKTTGLATALLAATLGLTGCAAEAASTPAAPTAQGQRGLTEKTLRADGAALAESILRYEASRGEFPMFVEMVSKEVVQPGVSVTQYSTRPSSGTFRYCLVADTTGDWVAFQSDQGGVTLTGKDRACAFAP